MKPTKNRVFCHDCGRHKMVFETEKKAATFMKFNVDEIESENGYAPNRSYFCIACNGFHVTSKENILNVKSKTEKVLEKYNLQRDQQQILKEHRKQIKIQKQGELVLLLDTIEQNLKRLKSTIKNSDSFKELLRQTTLDLDRSKQLGNFKGSNVRKKQAEALLNTLKEN